MNSRARKMVGHGAIVLFIGLAAGFGLVMSLILGILGFLPAFVFAVVLMVAMVIVARWAFSKQGEKA